MKPGYKTSEFYFAVFTALGAIAVAFGVLSQVEATELAGAVGALASAVIVLVGAVQPIVAYIKGRSAVKEAEQFNAKSVIQ